MNYSETVAQVGYSNAPLVAEKNESIQNVVNGTAGLLAECLSILDAMLGSPTAPAQGSTPPIGLSSAAFSARSAAIELRTRLGNLRELVGNVG